jgi:ParB family transcriptional regulator, chromosome partitioning protein
VAKPKPGMGRGLQAILSVSADADTAKADELRDLPLELISPNAKQPRRHFDEDALNALAGSLGERGVLQPALVRPRDDAEAIELALIENMAREDLNPIEEARACAALVEELGLTREEVGRRVGRSRVAVSNLMRLLDLPDEVIELLERGALSEGHGRGLLLAEDHGARASLARTAAHEGWSVRTVEARARKANDAGGAPRRRVARAPRGSGELHPDQEQAVREIADALTAALGAEVLVKATSDGGYRAEIAFSDAQEAIELARRVRPRAIPGLLEHSR